MTHKSFVTLLSSSLLAVSVCVVVVSAQKPVRQVGIHADGGSGNPKTLDDLWAGSAVVIEGRVVDARPANQTFTPTVVTPPGAASSPATLVQTDYVIEVDRILKSDNAIRLGATTVIVRRLGGTVDRGAYIDDYVDTSFARFTNRGRYVLFLEPAKGTQLSEPVYLPAVGADSAFEMLGDQVVPLGRAIASQQLATLGVEQFLSSLARKGGK